MSLPTSALFFQVKYYFERVRQVGVEPHKKTGKSFHFLDSGWINHPPGFYYVFKREISAPFQFSSSFAVFLREIKKTRGQASMEDTERNGMMARVI